MKNYVSVNGYDSSLADVKFGAPQGLVLGLLLFLIYINDLDQTLKFCNFHHFEDDTKLPHSSKLVNNLINMLTLI